MLSDIFSCANGLSVRFYWVSAVIKKNPKRIILLKCIEETNIKIHRITVILVIEWRITKVGS